MNVISPEKIDDFVNKLLERIDSDYEPEQVPIIVEFYSKLQNCYINVEEKVKRDGGNIHYGWAVYQSEIICEAARHAVWENDEGELIDITPNEFDFKKIMFVSDNDFVYTGQLIDNIRINRTKNTLVDDFIFVCEKLENLYTYGVRIDDNELQIPNIVIKKIKEYELLKSTYFRYISSKARPDSKCFCGGNKNYKNCHGKTIRQKIIKDYKIINDYLYK